jgi:nitrite reductase (NO-forming)
MNTRKFTTRGLLLTVFVFLASCGSTVTNNIDYAAEDLSKLERIKQVLVAPPFFPKHDQVAKGNYKIIEVELLIEEKKIVIDDKGTVIWAFTYNGTVPGPMIVAHQGDYIEVRVINPKTSLMEHNVDFHSTTGALGGGGMTHVAPGEEVTIRFRATKTGTFVYHCAPGGAMIPWHVVHGMNGAITILPRQGLEDGKGNPVKYDKAYYIGEQDFYIAKGKGKRGRYKKYENSTASYSDDMKVMETLIPSHIVFNGAVGALTGDNSMKAKVGESVLFVHSQANYDTRPHIIGGHGDYVWERGSFADKPQTGLETWFVAGGSAGAAIYTFKQPGVYAYVNHNLIEAVLKGATAHVVVEGEWNNDLLEQVKKPAPIK